MARQRILGENCLRASQLPDDSSSTRRLSSMPHALGPNMKHMACFIATAAAAITMIGCASDRLAQCPSVSVLVDTATLPVFSADGKSVAYLVRMTSASRDCDVDRLKKDVGASVDINFRAIRSEDGPAANYVAPYFVAVSSEGHLLAKQAFSLPFTFQQNQKVVEFSDAVNSIQLAVGRDKKPADYGILVGFQLTKEQLNYNRRAGRYAK